MSASNEKFDPRAGDRLVLNEFFPSAPDGFGYHPGIIHHIKRLKKKARKSKDPFVRFKAFAGPAVPISTFIDSRHPSVIVIPRNRHMSLTDEWGDTLVYEIDLSHFWFSSTDFFLDQENGWLYEELNQPVFWRLGDISQLGFLVPPHPTNLPPGNSIAFVEQPFMHTRWIHCWLMACMAEVILARNGFSEAERIPTVLAIAHHDDAMPAGGDSVKRIDPVELDEVNNFAEIIHQHGLDKRWQKKFGFDLNQATTIVKNQGVMGLLCDALDRMSYVSLDCYFLGRFRDGAVRDHCVKHPLFMDVWQDIKFTPDKKQFAFTNPDRLYQFLMARAYEHQQLLLNPYARILDFTLTKAVRTLYHRGIITKAQLLEWNNPQLMHELNLHYPGKFTATIEPDDYMYRRFDSHAEMVNFCQLIGFGKIDHHEHLKGFNPCLDWPVYHPDGQTKIAPLYEVLTAGQISLMNSIIESVKGYFVYWQQSDETEDAPA